MYLLQLYGIDDAIAKYVAALKRYTQPSTMSATQYVEALVDVKPRCGEVYNEYDLQRISIEGKHESVHHSMRSY